MSELRFTSAVVRVVERAKPLPDPMPDDFFAAFLTVFFAPPPVEHELPVTDLRITITYGPATKRSTPRRERR